MAIEFTQPHRCDLPDPQGERTRVLGIIPARVRGTAIPCGTKAQCQLCLLRWYVHCDAWVGGFWTPDPYSTSDEETAFQAWRSAQGRAGTVLEPGEWEQWKAEQGSHA